MPSAGSASNACTIRSKKSSPKETSASSLTTMSASGSRAPTPASKAATIGAPRIAGDSRAGRCIVFANGSSRAISAAVSPVESTEPLSTISHSCGGIVCAAMLSASRRRFVASLRAGVTTEYRSGRLTSRGCRDTLARMPKRARHKGREPDLQDEKSVEGVSRHRLSRTPLGDQAADAVRGDELPERGTVGEQEVGRAALELGAEPSIDGVVEEAGFRLVDDPVGNEAARDLLEEILRRATLDLERRRDRGRELHDSVVEKRHAHFERMRHRHAVGVVEHVVDE